METNEQGLTKEEKLMFFILFLILMLATGVLVIKTFSQKERMLVDKTPLETEKIDRTEESNTKTDVPLIEEKTENKKIAYVKKANKKKTTTLLKDVKEEENVVTPVITQWDFPSEIVTSAKAGDTIFINRNVVLEDGKTDLAQVTVRKLIEDTYMIQDISENVLTLTEGTYMYYYTYANITKKLELIVTGDLNPVSIYKPSIIDTVEVDEDLKNFQESLDNVTIGYEDNKLSFTLKEESMLNEIPLYFTLDQDLTEMSIHSKTYGIRVNKTNIEAFEKLKENEFVMWINLEIISTMESDEISILIDDVTYTITTQIHFLDDEESVEDKEDMKDEENSEEDNTLEDKDNLEDSFFKEDLKQDTIEQIEEKKATDNDISEKLKESSNTISNILEELS